MAAAKTEPKTQTEPEATEPLPRERPLPSERESSALVEYVIQREAKLVVENDEKDVWIDVATVMVPPRTKRRSVVLAAFEQAGYKPRVVQPGEVIRVRVLDVDSAEVLEAKATTPEPEWLI